MSTDEKVALEDYPCHAPSKIEVLKAKDIYRFFNDKGTFGRWQAVVLVKSYFKDREADEIKSSRSVRVYRWIFRKPRKYDRDQRKYITDWDADSAWFQEQELTINKEEYANEIIDGINEFIGDI
jgi:hypothetical protein